MLNEFILKSLDFSIVAEKGEIIETTSIKIDNIEYKIGKYNVIIENDGIFVIHLFAQDGRAGRNTAIVQGTIKLFSNTVNKFEVHLYYIGEAKTIYDFPESNRNEIRLYKSLGAIIHDGAPIETIDTFDEFMELKNATSFKNKGNSPIFIDNINHNVYLKFSSASATESMLLLYALKYYDDDQYHIYRIKEPKDITNNILLELINRLGFKYNPDVYLDENKKIRINFDYETNSDLDTIRNQSLYNYLVDELYKKNKIEIKCAICEVCEDDLLEHAHILEVNKIKKMSNLSFEKKIEYANSPSNSILLCRNHHKLFDKNRIIIENNEFIDRNLEDEEYSKQTKHLITKNKINPSLVSEDFVKFVNLRYQNKH